MAYNRIEYYTMWTRNNIISVFVDGLHDHINGYFNSPVVPRLVRWSDESYLAVN